MCEISMYSEPLKSTEFVFCYKTCSGRICAGNIGDPTRTGPKKLFMDEEPPGVAKDE